MSRYGLLIDYAFCTGCHSCELACKQEHSLPTGQWGIKISQIGPWPIGEDKWQYTFIPVPTELCNLCGERVAAGKEPSCVQHCQANVMKFGPVEELAKEMKEKSHLVIFAPK